MGGKWKFAAQAKVLRPVGQSRHLLGASQYSRNRAQGRVPPIHRCSIL